MGVFLPRRQRVAFYKPFTASSTPRLLLDVLCQCLSYGNWANPFMRRFDFQEFQAQFCLFRLGQPLINQFVKQLDAGSLIQ